MIRSAGKGLFLSSILAGALFPAGCFQVPPGGADVRLEEAIPFRPPLFPPPSFPSRTFSVADFGGRGDGKTKNTASFRRAVLACAAAGGGRVVVPPGKWLTGAIRLESKVNLHVERGAEIHFTSDPRDYLPPVFTRWQGMEIYNYSPLIYARDCVDVAVTGPGKIFGHGKPWWGWEKRGSRTASRIYREMVRKGVPPGMRRFGTVEAGLRPQLLNFVECRRVLLQDFTVAEAGPFWTLHLLYCGRVRIEGVRIRTFGGPNSDGIDLDSCSDVLVEDCRIDAGDDCVALKSGVNEDGWRVGRPTERVLIQGVRCTRGHGGVVIGSEMSGGIRKVLVRNCFFEGTLMGIRLKSNSSRGGFVRDIFFQGIRMSRIRRDALVINTRYKAWLGGEDGKDLPLFRNLVFRNISCRGAGRAGFIQGLPGRPIEGLRLEDLAIEAKKGFFFQSVHDLACSRLRVSLPPRGGEDSNPRPPR